MFHMSCIFLTFLLAVSLSFEIQMRNSITDDLNYIQRIWEEIQMTGIEGQILDTSFMQGIKTGKLDPMCFGRYIVQDIYYVTESAKLWERACQDGQHDQKFLKYCNKFYDAEHKYEQFLKEQMFLSSTEPLNGVRKYIEDKISLYSLKTYQYIGVINYSCYKLYSSITRKILPESNQESAYFPWIQFNSSQNQYKVLQDLINSYQHLYDRDQIKKMILKFTRHELTFFKQSCPFNQKSSSFQSQ